MITFQNATTAPSSFNLFPQQPEPQEKSKIPFLFAAIPHELFDMGFKPATIGVYDGLARYVNWKAQMTVDDRKIITGFPLHPPLT